MFLVLRVASSLAAGIPGLADHPLACPTSIPCDQQVLNDLAGRGQWAGFFLAPWYRWDTVHYLTIAQSGYHGHEIETVWPPLYPLLIRFVAFVFRPPLLAALIVSNLATLVAFYLLYVAVTRRWGEHTGLQATILMGAFPTAFFLLAGYSESLFLALSLGSLLAAGVFSPPPTEPSQQDEGAGDREGLLISAGPRWALAGLLAALATLTRLQGVFLALPLLWQGYRTWHQGPNRADWRETIPPFLGASLAPLAFCAYAAAVHFGLGYDWPWVTLSKNWTQFTAPPWTGLFTNWSVLAGAPLPQGFNRIALGFDLASAVLAIVLLSWGARDLPVALSLFAWPLLLSMLMKVQRPSVLVSVSRYTLSIFPLFITLAQKLRGWVPTVAWAVLSFACQLYLVGRFTSWLWVA